MNWIDIAIVIILVLSSLFGIKRGFVKESLSLIVWVLAFWLAIQMGPVVGEYFSSYIDATSVRTAVGFALVLLAVLIIGGLINRLISRVLHAAGLGGIDRFLGFVFGFLRAILIIAVILFLMSFITANVSWWKESMFVPYFKPILQWLWQLFGDLKDQHPLALG